MDLPEPNQIRPTAENVAFAYAIARAQVGMPLPEEIVAGRELDALVAEKVMGLRADPKTARYLVAGYDDPEGWGDPDSFWKPVPAYSTDIADAWQVVEKLRERFPQIDIEILPDRVTVTLWEQCRHDGDALDPLDEIEADTVPLAICRAALAAVSHG